MMIKNIKLRRNYEGGSVKTPCSFSVSFNWEKIRKKNPPVYIINVMRLSFITWNTIAPIWQLINIKIKHSITTGWPF